jgi:predicted amidophosphoribosyltransferase
LGRVQNAKKPNKCIHIFCSLCIKKWNKLSGRCPVCRREINYLEDIDINEEWVSTQGDLYIKY